MKQLQLEVGKTYRARNGAEVKITTTNVNPDYPFIGEGPFPACTYARNGMYFIAGPDTENDLVAEVVPVAPVPLLSPLPSGNAERKEYPMWSGVLQYMPAALAAASRVSMIGNRKHNAGEPLHHARGKSPDHPDCMVRHHVDYDALRAAMSRGDSSITSKQLEEELGCLMWRTGLFVQEQLEQLGLAPRAPRAVLPGEVAADVLPKDGGLQK